jgi:hypothetical protein
MRKYWNRKNISDLKSTNREKQMINRGAYFSNFCIELTKKCNIRCRHCILDAQETHNMELGWPVIKRLIKEAAVLGDIKEIGFVGGEPFLELDTLINAVNLCKMLGMKASVVTNGSWAFSEEKAKKILEKLRGLTTLCVSTDTFHQEFVSIDRIRNVILSCHELGIDCDVYFCHLNDPVSEIEALKKQLAGVEGLYNLKHQPVVFLGRAATQIDINSLYSYDTRGQFCYSVDNPLVNSNGNVVACCGGAVIWPGNHPLQLGNIHYQTLDEIRKAADLNPIIHALRLWGPNELVHLVQKQVEREGYSFNQPPMDEIWNLCLLCKYIVANLDHAELLRRVAKDPEVYHNIAAVRLIELAEISMLLEEGNLDCE